MCRCRSSNDLAVPVADFTNRQFNGARDTCNDTSK